MFKSLLESVMEDTIGRKADVEAFERLRTQPQPPGTLTVFYQPDYTLLDVDIEYWADVLILQEEVIRPEHRAGLLAGLEKAAGWYFVGVKLESIPFQLKDNGPWYVPVIMPGDTKITYRIGKSIEKKPPRGRSTQHARHEYIKVMAELYERLTGNKATTAYPPKKYANTYKGSPFQRFSNGWLMYLDEKLHDKLLQRHAAGIITLEERQRGAFNAKGWRPPSRSVYDKALDSFHSSK